MYMRMSKGAKIALYTFLIIMVFITNKVSDKVANYSLW